MWRQFKRIGSILNLLQNYKFVYKKFDYSNFDSIYSNEVS